MIFIAWLVRLNQFSSSVLKRQFIVTADESAIPQTALALQKKKKFAQ